MTVQEFYEWCKKRKLTDAELEISLKSFGQDNNSDGYDPEGMEVWEAHCPACGHDFEDETPDYCQNCGQALTWEDEPNG